jgi:peptidoglycan/LPS O-acetylase OafA/YrhL
MAIALWTERRPGLRLSPARSSLLLGAGAAILVAEGTYLATHFGERPASLVGDLPAGVAFALLSLVALRGAGPGLEWMRWRPLVGMGIISYGFYLWHLPLLFFLRGIYPHGGFVPTLLIAFPIALALGVLSWRLVEKPVLDASAKRRRTKARPARSTSPYRPPRPRPLSTG